MMQILKHLLGFCGEPHINLFINFIDERIPITKGSM